MREILEHIEWEIERGELIRFHTGHDAIDYIKVLARDDKLWPSLTPTFEKVMRTPLVPGVAFTTTFDSQLKMTGQPRLSLIGLHFHLFLFDYCHDQMKLRPLLSDIAGYKQFDVFKRVTLTFKVTEDEDRCILYIFGGLCHHYPPILDL